MTAHREPVSEERGRPDAAGDRRYGDRAAGPRAAPEPDPDVRGPQDGYDATADAADRTGTAAPDGRDTRPPRR